MSADLVPVDNMAAVEAMDPETQALAVTQMLTEARSWLAHAVEATEPKTIANFKAQMATLAEATKQLNLSKEIQLDAQEMVRRAERGVGVAIRKGQESGEVAKMHQGGGPTKDYERNGKTVHVDRLPDKKPMSPLEAAQVPAPSMLTPLYAMTDGVTNEQFDSAIIEAKSEGDLSRANVVRKVKQQARPSTREQRADMIQKLANEGYSSRQMPVKVGVTEESVRQIARDFGIEIPADKTVGRTRRIDSDRIVNETVIALEGLVMGVELIDIDAVDTAQASQWADSLSHSLKVLNRFYQQIRKAAQ